jgi:multiple sugar transport system substrate-binding protein
MKNSSGTDESGSNGKETVTIKFWKAPHSQDEEKIWAGIIDKFEEQYPNIKVEHLVTPWDTYEQQYTAAFAGSNPPDVSYQTDWVVNFANQGKLADLSPYFTEDEQGNYSDSAIEYATIDGKLIGRPFIALTSVMFYNKDIFAANNIEIPQTWDELLEAAKKATVAPDQFGIGLATNPVDYWQSLSFIYQSGADVFNQDMTANGFNNEEGIRGLKFVTDLMNSYKVINPMDHFSTGEQLSDAFYNGKIAMLPSQVQFSGEIKKNAPNLNYGVFPMPAGPGNVEDTKRWAYSGMGLMSIAEASKHKEEAYKFIDFITTPDIEKMYLEQVGFFSPQVDTNKVMYQDDEIMQVAGETIRNMQVVKPHASFGKVLDVMQQMFEASFRGMKTPEDAIKDAAAEVDKILKP